MPLGMGRPARVSRSSSNNISRARHKTIALKSFNNQNKKLGEPVETLKSEHQRVRVINL